MKWKASSKEEAGSILRLLSTQGEPLLRKLDEGIKVEFLQLEALHRSAEQKKARDDHYREAA